MSEQAKNEDAGELNEIGQSEDIQDAIASAPAKPMKYFIDFENVHGAGLKGVDELSENDEVIVIYSQAAETFHIEHAIDILKSKARINFVEVDGGTRNAADFQLIVALYGAMSDEFDYAIVSGDGGFDAAVKMGERMGLPSVRRMANIRGDIEPEKPEKPKSRRTRRKRSNGDDASAEAPVETAEQNEPRDGDANASATAENGEEQPTTNGRSRRRRGGRSKAQKEEASTTQPEEPAAAEQSQQVDDTAETTDETIQQPKEPRRRPRRRSNGQKGTPEQTDSPSNEAVQQNPDAPSQNRDVDAPGEPTASVEPSEPEPTEKDTSSKRRPRRRRREQNTQQEQGEPGEAAEPDATSDTQATSEDESSHSETAPSQDETDTSEGTATTTEGEASPNSYVASEADFSKKLAHVRDVLTGKGIQLEDERINTIARALQGVQGRQDFYRNIIKIERQQRGRELYHQVRDCYDVLTEVNQ